MPTKSKKLKTQRAVRFTFTPRPEPRFQVGAYRLATGERAVVKIIEWLGDKWVYYLSAKLASYRLSVFSETEFVGFGAIAERMAA